MKLKLRNDWRLISQGNKRKNLERCVAMAEKTGEVHVLDGGNLGFTLYVFDASKVKLLKR